jgi:VWFA-related protein
VHGRFLVSFVLAASAATVAFAFERESQRGSLSMPHVRAVYVSAVDRKDAPVTDLTASDLVLKEGGRTREIVKIEHAAAPLDITVIVDDSGTGIFRYPVATFIDRLRERAQFSIERVVGQVQRLVDYTSDIDRLRNAVLNLGPTHDTPKGGQVVEAVLQASKDLQRRDPERPVIIVLTDTDTEYSSLPAQHVLDELQQSGAVMYVISVLRRQVLNSSPTPQTGADKPSDLLDRQLDINRVLGDGPRQSGGRRIEITGLAGPIPEFQEIAEELIRQYLITYIVPAGERLGQKLNVSAKRRGVSVRAPSRAETP